MHTNHTIDLRGLSDLVAKELKDLDEYFIFQLAINITMLDSLICKKTDKAHDSRKII